MTDIASLAIMVDARSAEQAATSLDKMTGAGAKAEAAAAALAAEGRNAMAGLGQVASGAEKAAEATGHASGGLLAMAKSAGLTSTQLQVLVGAAHHSADALIAGINPVRILGVELVKSLPALTGATGGVNLLGGAVLGTAAAVAVLAAPLVAMAAGFVQGEKDATKFANALAVTGGYAAITGVEYERMVQRIQKESHDGFGAVRETLSSLVASGRFTGQTLEYLTDDILKLARFTGQSAAAVTKSFEGMGDRVSDFAAKFNEHYHMLTFAQYEHIRLLEEQGKTTEAQLSLAIAIHKQLGTVGSENLGILEKAWRGVAGAVSSAWEALKKFGNENAQIAGHIDTLKEQIAIADQAAKKSPAIYAPNTMMGQQLAGMKAELAGLEKIGQARRGNGQLQDEAIKAEQEHATIWARLGDNARLANEEVQKYERGQAAIRKANPASADLDDAARHAAVLAAIKKKYEPQATAADKKGEELAQRLAREARATEASIKGNLDLAAAYGVSDAAALEAQASAKATSEAIKRQGDAASFVAQQIRLAAAEQAVAGAKAAASLDFEAKHRSDLTGQVLAGNMTASQANAQLQDEIANRQLLAAAAEEEKIAKERAAAGDVAGARAAVAAYDELQGIITGVTKARTADRESQIAAAQAADMQSTRDEIARLQLELQLIGATNEQRAVRLAGLQAEQAIMAQHDVGYVLTDTDKAQIASKEALAGATVQLGAAQAEYNDHLARTADLLAQIDQHAQDASNGLQKAFGSVSTGFGNIASAIGGLTTAMSGLAAKEEAINQARFKAQQGLQQGSAAWVNAEIIASKDAAHARTEAYGSMIESAEGFFKAGTGGYKALQVADIAFRTIEEINSIRSIAMKGAETAASVAAAGTQASAWSVTAFARTLASLPFPYNLAAGATVLAALAAVGAVISGGGGSGAAGVPIDQQRQQDQGAGSVLGDAKAKSDSIAKSLTLVEAHTNNMLDFNSQMLRSLRSIDNQIGVVAAAVAKGLGIGGMLSTSGLGLGTTSKGPGFGGTLAAYAALGPLGLVASLIPGLFGSKTKTTLLDQGVLFGSGSVGSIVSGGISGSAYEDIQRKTSNKFLGVTYSTSTKKNELLNPLDPEFAKQTTLLIGSLRDGVIAAAGVLGVQGAGATLDAFKLELGRISLKGLSSDEMTKAISAVFSKAADDMAGAVIPGLAQFQKAGEGLFETLERVAKDYTVVDVTLKSIGKTFGAVGLSSVAAREHLIDLMGGLDNLTSETQFYAENFLSDAERLAPVQRAVADELTRLGLTGIKTRAQFKTLVQGLDVSTAAGADLYAALMALAPAFAAVTEESKALTDAKSVLSTAYGRESDALKSTISKFHDIAAGLHAFGLGLYSGPAAALSPEQLYAQSKTEFSRVAGLAAQGNEQALGDLQNVSQAYLDASKAYYASSQGYFDDLDAVKKAVTAAEGSASTQVDVAQSQLDQMTAAVGQLIDLNQNVVTVAQAIANLNALMGGTSTPAMPTPTVSAPATTSSDNTAAVVQGLNNLKDGLDDIAAQLQADKDQRGAVATATLSKLSEVSTGIDKLQRTVAA